MDFSGILLEWERRSGYKERPFIGYGILNVRLWIQDFQGQNDCLRRIFLFPSAINVGRLSSLLGVESHKPHPQIGQFGTSLRIGSGLIVIGTFPQGNSQKKWQRLPQRSCCSPGTFPLVQWESSRLHLKQRTLSSTPVQQKPLAASSLGLMKGFGQDLKLSSLACSNLMFLAILPS